MKSLLQILFAMWKTGSLSLKIRNTTRMPTLTTIVQHSARSPSRSYQTTKRKKGIQMGKKEVKLFLFTDDMILSVENPKNSTSKLLEPIQQFSNVAGYKIKAQKSVVFLCTDNDYRLQTINYRLTITILYRITEKRKLGNQFHL